MAGAGYKLFSTGDVLSASDVNTYLQQQTVMVFASAAARTTALSGVLAEGMVSYLKDTDVVEIYTGAAWVSLDDPNAIQNSIVDAKGDIISATADNTPARLAVGNNGETLVADSSTSTGLRYQEPKATNPVLNSAFQVWQRGTSVAGAGGGAYTADRWFLYAGGQATVSRQATGDTTNLPFIQYCARVQRNSGSTDTTGIPLSQSFETINSIPFAGKTVTFSYYARRGANFSAASNLLFSYLYTGTGTDQNWRVTGYTGQANPIAQTATLTTTWQRFTFTATLATNITELTLDFSFAPVGTAGAADYFEVTGVQIEVGSVATPFKTYAGTIQGELAACKYYYQRISSDATSSIAAVQLAFANSTTSAMSLLPIATMRTTPSVGYSAVGNFYLSDLIASANYTTTAIAISGIRSTNNVVFITHTVASGLTSGRAYSWQANTTSTYFDLSAEL